MKGIINHIVHLIEKIETFQPTRERSLAITKLQEALMWLKESEEHSKPHNEGGASINPLPQ